MLENGVGEVELLEGMDAARGKGEIDRASADNVAFARICSPFVKLNFVAPSAEVSGEETTS